MIAAAKKTSSTERQRDQIRRREERRANKIVEVPRCKDKRRRNRLEKDDEAWLRYYCADVFWYDFTDQQRAMIAAIRSAVQLGGDQALAASRGEGKTTLCERLLLKYALQGLVKFSVLFAATATAAEDSLQAMREVIEQNKRIGEDYPEICFCVQSLEDTPNRAHYQLVTGRRHDNGKAYKAVSSRFRWCGTEIFFPNVPGAPGAGAIVATRGLDSASRGLKKKSRRPECALVDDPDTDETTENPEQAKKLEKRIDRGIAGLGDQQKGIARIMLTTLQKLDCVSARFTDPKCKPSWKGRRFRFLVSPPERIDLWEEYVALRQSNMQQVDDEGNFTDPKARGAHAFYLSKREQMDAGAKVANEHRFNGMLLEDGSQLEVSAIQRYFNEVARIGQAAVSAEYDNSPVAESGPIESGITPHRIQRQLSGFDRRLIPAGCIKLTRGIDCRKVALHWVVRAWRADGTPFTIDYGIHEVKGTKYGSDEGLDVSLKRAILEFLDESKDYGYHLDDGEVMPIHRTLIDAGWRTDAVYAACIEAGLGVQPVMGFGKSNGCTQANFSPIQKQTDDRIPGDGYFLSARQGLWLVCADTDRWKAWEHDRWMTSPGKIGCMTLFGTSSDSDRLSDDEKSHHSYAHHICNEVEIEEPYKGGMRRRWKTKSENQHYLDASYYANVAARMEGILLTAKVSSAVPPNRPPAIKDRQRVAYL